MKIGIITMHSVVHHGSVLQAYATQLLLERFGHEVFIINYRYPNKWQVNHGMKPFIPSLKTKIARTFCLKAKYRGRKKIQHFMKSYYHLTREFVDYNDLKNNIPNFDVYLSGSDQIWNPRFTCGDPGYFFYFLPDNSNLMSFSSSLACKNLDKSTAYKYKCYLEKYKFISVRENQGAEIINDLIGKKPSITLDPTLMIDSKQWYNFVKKNSDKRKYIFLYILDYAFNPKPYIYKLTKYVSDKYNLDIICNIDIPSEFKIRHKVCKNMGIEDFLSLIYNSFIVITSSFHGVAFSLNFGKPLLAVVKNDNKDDRLTSLLENLNLQNCIVPINSPMDSVYPFYNLEKEQSNLKILQKDTYSFLNSSLSYFQTKING